MRSAADYIEDQADAAKEAGYERDKARSDLWLHDEGYS